MSSKETTALHALVGSKGFGNFILLCIFFNAIIMGLQSYPSINAAYESLFEILDGVLLGIFTVEIILKIIVYRSRYFRDRWNLFDFLIVAGSLAFMQSQFISILRMLRVLRILRTISSIPSLRRIVTSLFMAVPTIGSISLLMFIIFYIYGIIGSTFYGEISPEYFGDLSSSLVTLFQIATFDDWANIYRSIAEVYPISVLYFISFILIAVFVVLNLVVGEIVNNAAKIPSDDNGEDEPGSGDAASEIAQLRKEVRELKYLLQGASLPPQSETLPRTHSGRPQASGGFAEQSS
ncbi:ion transporter [Paenibacillus hamazuiensis]|uniref:ion transporter n=1 Tax=Paenibacillus hamazuiensis TaxID=2936508 RepID=UPI00200FBA76|nr:ion transporter [Paenibacillus hamazuiensis]